MATFRKRGTKWQAQIRRDGYPNLSKTFHAKEDALRWSRETERLIDRGENLSIQPTDSRQKFSEILSKYEETITPSKRSASSETAHLSVIKRHPIAQLPTGNISATAICRFRDDRLKQVSNGTVRREIAIVQHALKIAHNEWGVPVRADVLKGIVKPPPGKPRTRRLENHEPQAIAGALQKFKNPLVQSVFDFALATGMRRGEILSLKWSDVDIVARTAFLPITKNGDSRTVPLNQHAIQVLEQRRVDSANELSSGRAFPISANAFRLSWERLKKRAGIDNLRFHDLRHEAISRFFELGLTVPEVALISGHKDPRMLFRYTHLRAVDVARKLQNLEKSEGAPKSLTSAD